MATTISLEFDRTGGSHHQRVKAAFLIMFKVNAAWVPITLGSAPLLEDDGNGSVTDLERRLLQFGLTFNNASLPTRGGTARKYRATSTG